MKIHRRILAGTVALAWLSAPLMARGLAGSDPAPGATVSNLSTLSFHFSEPLDRKASGASLTMMEMPGVADHPPMKMGAMKSSFAKDGKTLILSARAPLAAGKYRADWWATSEAGNKDTGQIAFTVK